ncbi:MAG: TIM barrel protein [Saprospiraceae bacterium]|nr:TIM barrel protein [Saprospiraceae bacterium]
MCTITFYNRLFFIFFLVITINTSCKNEVQNAGNLDSKMLEIPKQKFMYSLAQWSLHRSIQSKKLDPMDFALKAKELGFSGIEYVSTFYKNFAKDSLYLSKLKQRAAENSVQSLLIMVDDEGDMGVLDEAKRNKAVENHYKWVDAAAFLGCHSIRVNAYGEGSETDVSDAMVLGLKKLCVYAKKKNINVIVENHGGYSSHGVWLKSIISRVNMPNCGTLPDFGNFCLKRENNEKWGTPCIQEYDRYKGIVELMPFAKGVSAKSYEFDATGNETTIDYARMAEIVKSAGYSGWIGIEWEGNKMTEEEGIKATLALVKKHFN